MKAVSALNAIRLLVIAIVLALFAATLAYGDSGANSRVTCDHVELIEVNHYLNCAGETQLDQVIFWDYSHGRRCFVVRDWRMARKDCLQSMVPYRTPGGLYRAVWCDVRDGDSRREVTAGSFIETWTDFDAEQANREVTGFVERRGLSVPELKPLKRKGAK